MKNGLNLDIWDKSVSRIKSVVKESVKRQGVGAYDNWNSCCTFIHITE